MYIYACTYMHMHICNGAHVLLELHLGRAQGGGQPGSAARQEVGRVLELVQHL